MGYKVEADLFSASEVGAPHKRERLFILAHSESMGHRRGGNDICERKRLIQVAANKWDGVRGKTMRCCESQLADTTQQPSDKSRATRPARWDEYTNCRWPARPGQPQYEWEEPRVVVHAGSTKPRGLSGSERQTISEAGKASKAVANPTSGGSRGESGNTLHQRGQASKGGAKSLQKNAKRKNGTAKSDDKSANRNGNKDSQRQAQSSLGRAVNGTAGRVDRLRLLGNGVVPQCAEKAFITLMGLFE